MGKDKNKTPKPPLFGGRYSDSQFNACLHYGQDQWELYASGYQDAAEAIASEIIEDHGIIDTLVYPLIYLCRHHIELRLKILIRDVTALLDDCQQREGHKIDQLWAFARPMVEQAFAGHSDAPALDIEELLNQFVAVDPRSTTFRYPAELGESSGLAGMRHLNVAQFYEGYQQLVEMIGSIHCGVSYFLEYKLEMQAEMRANMDR